MREACSRGTSAASLTRPMRLPLRSSTGMPISSVKNSRLSAIDVTGAPSAQPSAVTCFDVARSDALYTAFALTPFPIWRIRARNRKEKRAAAAKADAVRLQPTAGKPGWVNPAWLACSGASSGVRDERHEVGRSTDGEHRNIAVGPLHHIAGELLEQGTADSADHSANPTTLATAALGTGPTPP